MAPLFWFNPLVPLLEAYRETMIYGRWPPLEPLAVAAIAGLLITVVGLKLFNKACRQHIEDI